MEKVKLSEKRRRILRRLARSESAMTVREIGQACGEHNRASDWARATLNSMQNGGLVETLGISFDGGATWAITPAGRALLNDDGETK